MTDRSKAPAVQPMTHLELPVPSRITTDNGITLNYYNGGSQEVCQLDIMWPGGLDEAPSQPVARLMAILMREGTEAHSAEDISETLDFNGAMLKIVATQHHTTLTLLSLNSKAANVLPLVTEIINTPAYDDTLLAKYREIEIQNLMLQLSNVSTLSSNELSRLLKGPSHPQAIVPTAESVGEITSDSLREWHRRVIQEGRPRVFLSGRITDELLKAVERMLESVPSHTPMPLNVVPFMPQPPITATVTKPGAMQASVSIGLPAIKRDHPDYVRLRFTVIALGGYFGSRLMKNIREDKGYTYGIMSYLAGGREGSDIMVMAQADASYVGDLIREVGLEMEKLASEPIAEDEMMRLRQHIATSLMENLDSPFAIMEYYKTMEAVGIPAGYFSEQVETLAALTPEMIMDMASRYLNPSQMRIAVCR